jgi:magnesium chelatase subunit I
MMKKFDRDSVQKIKTLGQLRSAGYQPRSISMELRENLIDTIKTGQNVFEGIWGYEDTVIPDIQRAILAGHNINLLGLRGQAKTRIARMMVSLLDPFIPVISGSEINDDPMMPLSYAGRKMTEEMGNDTPVSWIGRDDRYTEKLATPDVSIADLIGDVDPIKAASLKLPYSDERVIHFGLIPRAHRGIFVINELPDLQARIQVALFNILQEGDIQIRGFRLRLPLDIRFVFTANPEDYTNRGSIVTPLKDRIGSQIITHYPGSVAIGKKITLQEAKLTPEQKSNVRIPELTLDLIEQVAIEARNSEFIDAKSGVSARLTISALENLVSAAERRMLLNKQSHTIIRVTDLYGIVPAITGKVELVYEGEQEGPVIVARNLIGKAIRGQFNNYFPDPEKYRKQKGKSPYASIVSWFNEGNAIDLISDMPDDAYQKSLDAVPSLRKLVVDSLTNSSSAPTDEQVYLMMEYLLHGLAEFSLIGRNLLGTGLRFKDLISGIFTPPAAGESEEDFDDEGDNE